MFNCALGGLRAFSLWRYICQLSGLLSFLLVPYNRIYLHLYGVHVYRELLSITVLVLTNFLCVPQIWVS